MIEDGEVGGSNDGGNDKIVKRLPSSKKLNIPTGYFIFLYSNISNVLFEKDEFTQKLWLLLKVLVRKTNKSYKKSSYAY